MGSGAGAGWPGLRTGPGEAPPTLLSDRPSIRLPRPRIGCSAHLGSTYCVRGSMEGSELAHPLPLPHDPHIFSGECGRGDTGLGVKAGFRSAWWPRQAPWPLGTLAFCCPVHRSHSQPMMLRPQ